MEEKRTALSPAEYWEWRTTIAELDVARHNLMKAELEFKLMQQEAEILNVRQQLFVRTRLQGAKDKYREFQNEYERYKLELEKTLGESLSGKVIDDVTFEVKPLPDETTT